MRSTKSLLTLTLLLTGVAGASGRDSDMPVRQEETTRQSYTLNANAARALLVDNIWGNIEVTAGAGNQVQAIIKKMVRADSQAAADRAKQEVTLEASQDDSGIRLYVDGPFRCHDDCGNCCGNHWHDRDRYIVRYDFTLQVPSEIALTLKTVNDGDIKVTGVAGDFSLHNVNGSIDATDAAGSGTARTVNGHVKMTFRANPTKASDFSTINGPIQLYFRPGLGADFRFKNFNGGIYSDFELTSLPGAPPQMERTNGRFRFRASSFTGGRVGAGGPEIKIENLNGDIRVLERSTF